MLKYYTTEQVCDIVNEKLNLDTRNNVSSHTLMYWLRKSIIESMKTTEESGVHRFNPEQLQNILDTAFIRIKLGVELSSVNKAKQYFKDKHIPFDYE